MHKLLLKIRRKDKNMHKTHKKLAYYTKQLYTYAKRGGEEDSYKI